MEDWYVNGNFAATFLWESIILLMGYVEFFTNWIKWSVHVIDALNQLHTWFDYCFQWFIHIIAVWKN